MKTMLAAILGSTLGYAMDEAGSQGSDGGGAKPKKEREVQEVVMSDGRKVEFVGKRKLLKESIIEGNTVTVRMDFRNGNTVSFRIPDELLLKSAGHGMEQKLGDETAGEEDVDDMQLAVEALVERLQKEGLNGWSKAREGGGFGGASILVQALAKVTGKPVADIKAFLKAKVDAGTTYAKLNDAFSEDPTVGPVIKELKKAKAGDAKVDTAGLLGALAG